MKKKSDTKTKLYVVNGIMIAAGIALLFTVVGYLREGLIAASASEKYDFVRSDTVNETNHDIDFIKVHDSGSTATSWIYLPDTGIDYPMVQGPDNDTYLEMDAYGNPSKAGAIFINYANSPDMTDNKTIIFGHNMNNGTMFTPLHKFADEEWGRMHTDAYIYMDNGRVRHYKLRYYVFTDPMDPNVYVLNKSITASDAAADLESVADIVYDNHTGGNLICLSTCTYHTKRTVVVFEEVDDKKPVSAPPSMENGIVSGNVSGNNR